jgi:hypothetical protein
MFKIVLIAVAIVVIFLVIVALQPSEFRVQRAAQIAAPVEVVFEQVNNLRKWQAWSPWERIDPALKRTYEGPVAGTGAFYRWAGNNKVGEGSMTITESRPNELIDFKLEFLKPFKATNAAKFTFKSEGNRTTVTWTMDGKKIFLTKAIGLFMSMDKMIGSQFEQGLANLSSVTGAIAKK